MENKFKIKNTYKMLLFLGLVLAIVFNIKEIKNTASTVMSVLSPVFMGCLMAFILNILVTQWEKIYFPKTNNKYIIKTKRGICIILSLFSITLVLLLVSKLVIPRIQESVSVFSDSFPKIYDTFREKLFDLYKHFPNVKQIDKNLDGKAILENTINILSTWTGGFLSFVGSFFSFLMNIVIGLIIAIYIVSTRETLKRQFDKLFNKFMPSNIKKKFYYILEITNETFHAFIVGQLIEAIILGTLCTLGLWIFRFPYAPMIGSVIGLTALIPLIGAYIGGLFGFLMILTISPFKAVLFIIFLTVLQQIEGNLIYPKVVGNSVGLPGLWVIISIIIGGGLFGITGVFFGLPIAATIYKILKDFVNKESN